MTIDLDAIRKRAEPFRGLKLPNHFAQEAMDDREALLSHITAQDAEHKAEMLGVIEFGCSYVRRFWTEKHFSEPLKSYDDILAAYLAQKENKDV